MVVKCPPQSPNLYWSDHALQRLKERKIDDKVLNVSTAYIMGLNYYTTNGCYYYCDPDNNVTYLVRDLQTNEGEKKTVMTIYSRNPIQMARRVCEIKGWNFNCICRDHLFGNCRRRACRYVHKSLNE